ncbi:MAG: hypothetical protein PGN29_16550 [Gordonia paraffinivorans]
MTAFVDRTDLGGVLEYRTYRTDVAATAPTPGTLAALIVVDGAHPRRGLADRGHRPHRRPRLRGLATGPSTTTTWP